jgi:UDP-N-acetylmuramoylalanine--D-glutamate ligase
LPQRLELFCEVQGRRFYNDSTATTPESTVAALNTLDMPIWLLAGGRNKGCDFTKLSSSIVERARGAAFFSSAKYVMRDAVLTQSSNFPCSAHETLPSALDWCLKNSRAGEAILLSPGCASTDQFKNFRERGIYFENLVRARVAEDHLAK